MNRSFLRMINIMDNRSAANIFCFFFLSKHTSWFHFPHHFFAITSLPSLLCCVFFVSHSLPPLNLLVILMRQFRTCLLLFLFCLQDNCYTTVCIWLTFSLDYKLVDKRETSKGKTSKGEKNRSEGRRRQAVAFKFIEAQLWEHIEWSQCLRLCLSCC